MTTWNDGLVIGGGAEYLPTAPSNSSYPNYPNYANTDDILLDDATRPRDRYGFRLKPGRQMDKFDYRSSNKNILSQSLIKGVQWIEGTEDGKIVGNPLAIFKNEWQLADIPGLEGYKYGTSNAYATYENVPSSDAANHIQSISEFLEARKSEFYGKRNVVIKDFQDSGNTYGYVGKGASYVVQYGSEFIYPYGNSGHDTTQIKKVGIYLFGYTKEKGWWQIVRAVMRTCSSPDSLFGLYVGYIEPNTYLSVMLYHTWGTGSGNNWVGTNVLCTPTINLVQIS